VKLKTYQFQKKQTKMQSAKENVHLKGSTHYSAR